VVLDGQALGSERFSTGSSTRRNPDGSWTVTNTSTAGRMLSDCQSGARAEAAGTHTEAILNSAGKTLAEGSYTAKP
jgi:hypothetical protein